MEGSSSVGKSDMSWCGVVGCEGEKEGCFGNLQEIEFHCGVKRERRKGQRRAVGADFAV